MLAVDFGHEKTQFIRAFLFSKPVKVTLGTSIKEISFGKRRPRTKQRPKKLQQKYYCNTSRKVLHAALEKKFAVLIYI